MKGLFFSDDPTVFRGVVMSISSSDGNRFHPFNRKHTALPSMSAQKPLELECVFTPRPILTLIAAIFFLGLAFFCPFYLFISLAFSHSLLLSLSLSSIHPSLLPYFPLSYPLYRLSLSPFLLSIHPSLPPYLPISLMEK